MKLEIKTIRIPESAIPKGVEDNYKYESIIEITPNKETIAMRIRTVTREAAVTQGLSEASSLYTYFSTGIDNTLPDEVKLLAIDKKIKKYNENIIKIGNDTKNEDN